MRRFCALVGLCDGEPASPAEAARLEVDWVAEGAGQPARCCRSSAPRLSAATRRCWPRSTT